MSFDNLKKIREAIIVCLIRYFEADFLWKVSLKILNSGIILKLPAPPPHILVNITSNAIDVDLLVIDSVRVAQTYVGKPHLSSQEHNHVHFRA